MSRRSRGQWFSAVSFLGQGKTKGNRAMRPETRPLRLEALEDRRVLAAVVVGTAAHALNGDTSSIAALIASPGPDGISLFEAIQAANATAGDHSISFAPGVAGATINIGGGLPTITGNLTMNGPITLYGNDNVRGLTIAAGANVSITGFSIKRSYAELGGAIHNSGTLTFTGGSLTENFAYDGGAIYNAPGATMTVTETTMRYNEVEGSGGAIFNDGTLTVSHSRRGYNVSFGFQEGAGSDGTLKNAKGILQNKALGNGGGIYNNGQLTVTDVSIIWNHAEQVGGGIFNAGTATVNGIVGNAIDYAPGINHPVSVSAISYNTGFYNGSGGVHNVGALTLNGASVLSNSGGVWNPSGGVVSSGTLTVVNSMIGDNHGAAGINSSGTATIINSNIYANRGMGIWSSGPLTLYNSVVAANVNGDVGSSVPITGSHNFVADGSGTGLVGTLTGDPKLEPPRFPADGLVPVMRPLPDSPLLNAGNNSAVPSGTTTDQRGVTRIKEGTVDIGPVEFGPETIVVTTLVDESDGTIDPAVGAGRSLREIIAHIAENFARPNEYSSVLENVTILFAPGLTGTLALTQGALAIRWSDVTIVGPGAQLLTIDGDAIQSDYGGLFYLERSAVAMSGLTFANGNATQVGGAIHVDSGSLTLSDAVFVGNTVTLAPNAYGLGGAISSYGSLYVSNVAFTGNSSRRGGAISSEGRLQIDGGIFTGNSAQAGGAIETRFRNSSDGDWVYQRPAVRNSLFIGNSATVMGGAIMNSSYGDGYKAELEILNSTFVDNTSEIRGGAIYNTQVLTVDNSTFYGNGAANAGNFFAAAGGAIDSGGLIFEHPQQPGSYGSEPLTGDVTLRNNIFTGTTAGAAVHFGADFSGPRTGNYNLVEDGSGGLANTIVGSPLLGPLQDNGGPTWTMAPLAGSPAINGGDPTSVAGAGVVPLVDQRGAGYSRVLGWRIDLGAVEVASGDFNNDGRVDGADFLAWQRQYGSTATPSGSGADGDGTGSIDGADLNVWREQFGQPSGGGAAVAAAPASVMQVTGPEPKLAAVVAFTPSAETSANSGATERDAAFVAFAQAEEAWRVRPVVKATNWRELRAKAWAAEAGVGLASRRLRHDDGNRSDSHAELESCFAALGEEEQADAAVDEFGAALVGEW
ncbi:choice-of-anchor Q domain-containing protein [Lacipirellula sp.]|uniref:choice-of-anchor Q domain-containing protein n=1 Tax=Lacipirellula sp. TaxID=2691419 RepID=UPI003D0DA9F9